MTVILGTGSPLRSTASEPVVAVGVRGADAAVAAPHVTVNGRPAFEQTFWCGTCALLFRRRSTAYPCEPDPPPSLDAQHWGWTHFLLDGHHKTEAAARIGQPLRMLSLLCLDGGNTDSRYARALPALFRDGPATPAWPG